MLSTLLVVGVISHLWCAARLVGIAHHSFYSAEGQPISMMTWRKNLTLQRDIVGISSENSDSNNSSNDEMDGWVRAYYTHINN